MNRKDEKFNGHGDITLLLEIVVFSLLIIFFLSRFLFQRGKTEVTVRERPY